MHTDCYKGEKECLIWEEYLRDLTKFINRFLLTKQKCERYANRLKINLFIKKNLINKLFRYLIF